MKAINIANIAAFVEENDVIILDGKVVDRETKLPKDNWAYGVAESTVVNLLNVMTLSNLREYKMSSVYKMRLLKIILDAISEINENEPNLQPSITVSDTVAREIHIYLLIQEGPNSIAKIKLSGDRECVIVSNPKTKFVEDIFTKISLEFEELMNII